MPTTGAFYFLEMNTRIQVEHPVTEMTTGLDLVGLQIRLARGEDLSFLTQESIRQAGHSIECRLYAENPAKNFMPSPGPLKRFALPPAGEGLRIDTGVREGDQISFHYDPMIAKIISQGQDRDAAIARMLLGAGRGRRRRGRHQCGLSRAPARITRPSAPATSTRALRPSMPASC